MCARKIVGAAQVVVCKKVQAVLVCSQVQAVMVCNKVLSLGNSQVKRRCKEVVCLGISQVVTLKW